MRTPILAGVAALALLGACTRADTTASVKSGNGWTRSGVLRFAENQDIRNLNPMLATSAAVGDLSMFLFSYAVRYNDKAEPVPDALSEIPTIENGDVSRDGLTLKYKLRPNIKFHDGVPMTAQDVKFSYEVMVHPKVDNLNLKSDVMAAVEKVDVVDDHTVKVTFKKVKYANIYQVGVPITVWVPVSSV